MKNKFPLLGLQCALLVGLPISFVSLSVAQAPIERWVPVPSDQILQLAKDSDTIEAMGPKTSFDAIVQFKSSLESNWKLKNRNVYLNLLIQLSGKLSSDKLSLSEEKRAELLKIFSASFLQEFDSMTAGQRVKTVWFFSGLTHGAIPYNDEVSRTLDLFIQTEMALEELKTTAETLPIPEKVDFSKYDWSSQPVAISGMSAKAIKDPELRKVWQSALDRDYTKGSSLVSVWPPVKEGVLVKQLVLLHQLAATARLFTL